MTDSTHTSQNRPARRRFLRAGTSVAAASVLALAGCAAPSIQDYASQTPVLDLRSYFNGTLDGYGIFTDRGGKVVRRFTVVIRCSWSGDEGVLDEDFSYSDGSKSRRVWTIVRQAAGRYTGTAGDVVGTAQGESRGNALRWTYVMALEVDGKTYHVDFDDWMYLQDDKVMLNKSVMSKFGLRLGEVILAFRRRG